MPDKLGLLASQREVWLGQQTNPESTVFHMGFYVPLSGRISGAVLEQAIRTAVLETDALQVRFVEEAGTPFQVLDSTGTWSLKEIDTSQAADPEAEAMSWMRADLSVPMDLSAFPTFGSVLIRTGADHSLWYQRFHHITLDATACLQFAGRVQELIDGSGEKRVMDPTGSNSIKVLLDAEHDYRSSADFTTDERYWQTLIAKQPPAISLSDKPAAAPAQFPCQESCRLTPSSKRNLLTVCDTTAALWPVIAVAAVAAYLHLYTGVTNVPLSVPVRARTSARTNTIAGMTVNILPFSTAVYGDTTLRTLLPRLGAGLDELMVHQRYRGEDVRRLMPGQGGGGRLFGPIVNIVTTDAGDMPAFLCGGPVEDVQFLFTGGLDCERLEISLRANPAAYSPRALAQHAEQFGSLLDRLLAHPDRPLSELADLVRPVAEPGAVAVSEAPTVNGAAKLSGASDGDDHHWSAVTESDAAARIAGIWQQVLEIDEVGPEEDFFDLGGHSLLAMDVIAAVAEEFHVRLAVRDFFSRPTVNGLVAEVLASLAGAGEADDDDEAILAAVADLSEAEAAALLDRLQGGRAVPGEVAR